MPARSSLAAPPPPLASPHHRHHLLHHDDHHLQPQYPRPAHLAQASPNLLLDSSPPSLLRPTLPPLFHHAAGSPATGSSVAAQQPPAPSPSPRTFVPPQSHDLSSFPRTVSSQHSPIMSRTEAAIAPSLPGTELHPSRKRRREPNWSDFYRNGLPKEIIVIEDSPEPTANMGRKLANPTPTSSSAAQPAKRRKRDAPPASRVQHAPARPSPSRDHHPNQITLSSDRTSSTIHTTAPTSLSSNSQREEPPASFEHKRTTRRRTAAEAKRKAIDKTVGPLLTYEPPPHPPRKIANVPVRIVQDQHQNKQAANVDDDDGHYIVVPDTRLADKYVITRLLGQGTFGKVVEAHDRVRNKAVAVKIVRSVQKYRDASRIELRVLATLKANDEANRNQCIHLRDCFDYRGHICIVTDLLGKSVFDFLKGNGFVPFPNSHIQHFARQLFTSVAFLHDLNLIHTDLKPENILLWDDSYQTFTYSRKIPSSSTTVNRQATQRKVLLNSEIRLIDFGSATFQDEYHSSVVSTRHYRAPEIILGLGWSYPCDIWSIGCILVEFYTGDALFQTHDNREHLAMMEAVIGTKIDSHLVQEVNRIHPRTSATSVARYFKRLKLDYPTPDTTRGSRRFVNAMKRLQDITPPYNPFLKNFLDLLRKIFVYDPAKRITAKQALAHPWFKELAQSDDGTEAAKIRRQKERREHCANMHLAQGLQ
ncbi:hypothetical protein HIM_05829 [Hirsutella minnesotensis 3608]|uniref:Protein kinase domain-containing protein n=1 Tax=Hirsutella minnesotensis 3608 TaxID=1043627 RepID=A0A0F7ZZS1_9HYPO|nr:hypothetical protein HIM_05829 [Hirsutella minnesotensis 3608]